MGILVTGGAGFIGSNIVKGLNNNNYDDCIYIADDLTDGSKHKNLNRLDFHDFIDYRDLIDHLEDFDFNTIFHLGACSDTTESNGRYMMDTNYTYSKTLLDYSLENNVNFIYASSASVYGSGKNGFSESKDCEYPLNVYAFSKYQFDRYVRSCVDFSEELDSQVVGLRYFNVYGPQENHKGKMASVPYHFYNQIKKGESMKLFEGSENFCRDFIYVQDVVDMNMFFHDNYRISGIFNCGTGKARSFSDIAKIYQDIYPDSQIQTIPFPSELNGKYQIFTQSNNKSIRNAGYEKPFTSLEKGIRKYAEILEKSEGYLI